MIAQLKITAIVLVFACVSAMPASLDAQEHIALSKGQTVYVPAYSHIYIGGKKRPFALAITLSIRNIDLDADITLSEVNYYGSKGKLIESFVEDAPSVKPQESVRFVIAEGDEGGGSGANFIVKWKSATEVNPPIIESIMIGAKSSQGISFTSRGRAITSY
ncbi:MAG: DUF3124 domain-containing protein [Desulfobacterales bacterium]